jgi:hypothetical protein
MSCCPGKTCKMCFATRPSIASIVRIPECAWFVTRPTCSRHAHVDDGRGQHHDRNEYLDGDSVSFCGHVGRCCCGRILGDMLWYQEGKRFGEPKLRRVCSLALSRDRCLTKTERFIGQWGVRVLIVARFCPRFVTRMAGRLRRAGIRLALPLSGGIDAWRDAGFTVAPVKPAIGGCLAR